MDLSYCELLMVLPCQMDIKVDGLSYDILAEALARQTRQRTYFENNYRHHFGATRRIQAKCAKINLAFRDFIGAVIGPGGKVIQEIQRQLRYNFN